MTQPYHPITISAMSVPTGEYLGTYFSEKMASRFLQLVPLLRPSAILRISALVCTERGHGTVSPSKLVGAWASRCSSSQLRGAAAACSRVHALRCRQY